MTSKKHFTYVIGKTSAEMNTDESQQHECDRRVQGSTALLKARDKHFRVAQRLLFGHRVHGWHGYRNGLENRQRHGFGMFGL